MLMVQKFLKSSGSAGLELLKENYGVNNYFHPSLPLVGLKYDQIRSPKFDPMVRECRGLVLDVRTWDVVAKPFYRFFNAGEDPDGVNNFDWTDFTATTKEDGSLILLYWYGGQWRINTSGSFGSGECGHSGKSWERVFWETCYGDSLGHRPGFKNLTYIFELCTPYNKVVRTYPKPTVYMLSAYHNETCKELSPVVVDELAQSMRIQRPESHSFRSMNCIRNFMQEKESTDKTFEGIVIRDKNGERYKIKSKTYLELHHLADNGNIANPKRLIPIVVAGESDEVLAYFPEMKEQIDQMKRMVEDEYNRLESLWNSVKGIESQKDFALSIKDKTPFSGLLFTARKMGGDLKSIWQGSGSKVADYLCS